ncbi:MAG: HDOD domain-containing protein [Candidatus Hydrogenedentota bacterium]|nr:MAG: HDOD domain-containing protein [Candidatus Hydrogenedentota bacterium]
MAGTMLAFYEEAFLAPKVWGNLFEMISDTAFLKKLAMVREIPTLPEVMEDVMGAVAADDSSARELAVILSKDQALGSKILKVANSAFFAQNRKIFDIRDAVVLLGFDSIAQLTLSTAVITAFGSMRPREGFDLYGFWRHSIATALASKMIAQNIGRSDEHRMAYTAGLLHDIGKLVLVSYFSGRWASVLERLESDDLFFHEAERLVLGFTHCDIAEWLCNRWNFPEKLVYSIARHHNDAHSKYPLNRGARIVRLADTICNRLRVGNSGNKKIYPLIRAEYSPLGIYKKDIKAIEQRLEERRGEIESILMVLGRGAGEMNS